MRTALARLAFLLLIGLATPGCMISTQDGEQGHVNSKMPDEVTFHFDTDFNRFVVIGRSLILAALGIWLATACKPSGRAVVIAFITLPACVGAGVLADQGLETLQRYRIDLNRDSVTLQIPPSLDTELPFEEIAEMRVAGIAYELGTGVDYAEYETMEVMLESGEEVLVDLEPLSVEQRTTLWQVIARRAQLTEAP